MNARLLPLAELDGQALGAWRELLAQAVVPNPFFDPDFVVPAARGLGETEQVALAVVEAGGAWRACLPVRRFSHWHRLPLPCVGTWRHRYCLLGTPLVAPGELHAVVELTEAMRSTQRAAFAALDWVPAEGPLGKALDEFGAAPIPFEELQRAALRRRPQNDYLEGRVKGKHRREFRRLARGLEEELGGELALVDRSGEAGAIETFLALEASGWKGRNGSALASDPDHAAFFRAMATLLGERGKAELLFLEAGGRVAAGRFSLLGGGASFCFKVAFDEELGRFSPGRELELRLVDRFHEQRRLEWMDSCADPGNELFGRLWPDQIALRTVAYGGRGALGGLAGPALRSVRKRRQARTEAGRQARQPV